jgi:two-component system phosphate regulon response regulator PhoB
MQTVLIVEDEKAIRSLLSFLLTSAGYETVEAADAISAIDLATRYEPDLALLDWRLPDMDGVKLLRYWKADEATNRMSVIMLSGQADANDRVTGLKAGADDYIAKPFANNELLARVQAVLRRSSEPASASAGGQLKRINGLQLDVRSLRVVANDEPVHLGPIEFKLLNLFMTHPDRALTRPQIVDKVWRVNAYVDERTVDVHVRRLRRALQKSGHDRLIQTVRGVGYRFASPDGGQRLN